MRRESRCVLLSKALVVLFSLAGACGGRPPPPPQAPQAQPSTPTPASEEPHAATPALPQPAATTPAPAAPAGCEMRPLTGQEFMQRNIRSSNGSSVRVQDSSERHSDAPETPPVRGSLSKAQVQTVIRENIAGVRRCFEQAMGGRRGTGRLVIHFLIRPDGGVRNVDLAANDSPWPDLPCCVADVIRQWTFPAPDGGGVVIVTYPFVAN